MLRPTGQAMRDRKHRSLCVFVAAVALFAVFITHGLMADDAMHAETAAECLATTADTSPGKLCTPLIPTATAQAMIAAKTIALLPEDTPRPVATGYYARHGPSDLQIFRT